ASVVASLLRDHDLRWLRHKCGAPGRLLWGVRVRFLRRVMLRGFGLSEFAPEAHAFRPGEVWDGLAAHDLGGIWLCAPFGNAVHAGRVGHAAARVTWMNEVLAASARGGPAALARWQDGRHPLAPESLGEPAGELWLRFLAPTVVEFAPPGRPDAPG